MFPHEAFVFIEVSLNGYMLVIRSCTGAYVCIPSMYIVYMWTLRSISFQSTPIYKRKIEDFLETLLWDFSHVFSYFLGSPFVKLCIENRKNQSNMWACIRLLWQQIFSNHTAMKILKSSMIWMFIDVERRRRRSGSHFMLFSYEIKCANDDGDLKNIRTKSRGRNK